MKIELRRIPAMRCATVVGTVVFLSGMAVMLTLALGVFALSALRLLSAGYSSGVGRLGVGSGLWRLALVQPAIYAVLTFVGTLVACWAYNAAAKSFGGIQFELHRD